MQWEEDVLCVCVVHMHIFSFTEMKVNLTYKVVLLLYTVFIKLKAYFVRNSRYFRNIAKPRALPAVPQSECKAIVSLLQIYLPKLVVSTSGFYRFI